MIDRYVLCLLALSGLVGCGGSAEPDTGSDGGVTSRDDASLPGTDGSTPGPDAGTSTGAFACTSGSLFSGHPEHDAEVGVHANDGDPLRGVEGRPLGWRKVIFVGNHLVTVVGQEVWSSDLSAAEPVVRRLAGMTSTGQSLLDGPCASARFANLMDVVAGVDGSLFVMDQTGNAILRISDPFEPASCTVHFHAGTSVDTPDITPVTPPNVGDAEGPGASAQFALPGRMTIDEAGNLYVWDEGNTSIRKIANDAAHTVSTLTQVESVFDGRDQDVLVDAMVMLDGTLYMYEHDTANRTILESVDVTTGARADLFRGRADVFGFASSAALQNGGMATDGTDLFVYFKGSLYMVSTAGAITHIAGDTSVRGTIEFEGGYDPAETHDAFDLQLANRGQYQTAGADSWLAIDDDDDLFFVGNVMDPYVQHVECGR